jgi:outer membrane protein OmpA-like peptidoglycan-associated protein
MLIRRIFILLVAMLTGGAAFAAAEADLQITSSRPGAIVTIDKIVNDGRLLINVADAAKEPLFGLSAADFTVSQSGRTAKILSVQPGAESLDVPRNIVLVLDNSFSMEERNAVKNLLAGAGELLKTIRPIDRVQIVVFDSKESLSVAGRKLRVKTFASSTSSELQDFLNKAYSINTLTTKTVLYEAMLAGLDLIDKMPAGEPRFMVVFSDGEDLNSAFKGEEVLKVAQRMKGFNSYAIDYHEAAGTDKFLAKFAKDNRGQIWKAKTGTNLVEIFQSVASRMQYYYVVNYLFPTTGTLAVRPALVIFDELRNMNPAGDPAGAMEKVEIARVDAARLTVRPVIDSPYTLASWKVVVSNSRGVVAETAGRGAPAAELDLPLPTADLAALATGGDLAVTMEAVDSKGQQLQLSAPPVKVNIQRTRAGLAVAPAAVTIEEVKTIDASPMLGQIYFDKGASEVPPRYLRFSSAAETAGFDEQKFRDTLEKYYQLLNIVGKRLADNAAATITLVGCNDNVGEEKGKKKLSGLRAEAVKKYLESIWNIAPERIAIEARNLPQLPSTSRSKEGQAENRRVEIRSADPPILAPIRSTYMTTRIDAPTLILTPDVVSPYGIASWKITAANSVGKLAELSGQGMPAKAGKISLLGKGDLRALAVGGDIAVTMELQDRAGQKMLLAPPPVKVSFIETSKRQALKQDQRIQEKYALILFDFDKASISGANQAIITSIVERIKALPQASVEIVGHTDNIGKDAYNIKLSERRAMAVYKLLTAAYGEESGDRIRHSGVGPHSPLYENVSPETRSFNRTVTITLEYLSAE